MKRGASTTNDTASNRAFLAEQIRYARHMIEKYPGRGYEAELAIYEQRLADLNSTED